MVGDGVCTKRLRLDCAALVHGVGKGQFSLVGDFSLASGGMGGFSCTVDEILNALVAFQ